MVVLKSMLAAIWTAERVTFVDRLSCTYFFFRWVGGPRGWGPAAGASLPAALTPPRLLSPPNTNPVSTPIPPLAPAKPPRFIYTAFLTVICLACPAVVIWLDPWEWSWPNIVFLVSGNTSALVFFWLAGPLFWPYFLVQTGLGYFRVSAMVSGLVGSKKSKGWKVRGRGRDGAGCGAVRGQSRGTGMQRARLQAFAPWLTQQPPAADSALT
jgi:hypothetical protein